MKQKKKLLPPLPIGSKVRIKLGISPMEGEVVEDFGRLAPGGKHIYRLLVRAEPDLFLMATADDLQDLAIAEN